MRLAERKKKKGRTHAVSVPVEAMSTINVFNMLPRLEFAILVLCLGVRLLSDWPWGS
jgi:hypothetical protein